jgi:hypothetical protein
MRCAQCGLENDDGLFICVGCDHILDTSFLGSDITGGAPPLDDDLGGPPTLAGDQVTGAFLTEQTSNGLRLVEPEPFATSEAKVLFDRDAVLAIADGVDVTKLQLSPFESHVITFIDGQRPVARLRGLAGVGPEDLRICLGMLADRGVLVRVGTARAAIDFDEKTGEVPVDGVLPDGMFGEPGPKTDVALLPEDLLSDDVVLNPVVTPLPINFHAGVADLASVALDFVDDTGPMTVEPGVSPFAAARSPPSSAAAVNRAPANQQASARVMPPNPASNGGMPPLPGVAPARAPVGKAPPMPGAAPGRPSPTAVPPIPGAGQARTPFTSGEGPAPAGSTPGIRPSLRTPASPAVAAPPARPVERIVEPPPPPTSTSAPNPVRRAPTENQLKARQAYELALKDLKDNKISRAFTYARAARELDPENDLYKELLDNWGRQVQGASRAPNGPKR